MTTTRDDLKRLMDDLPDGEIEINAVVALLRRRLAGGEMLDPGEAAMPDRHDLERLAREQRVSPVRFDDLKGDFWPEGLSVEAFLAGIEDTTPECD